VIHHPACRVGLLRAIPSRTSGDGCRAGDEFRKAPGMTSAGCFGAATLDLFELAQRAGGRHRRTGDPRALDLPDARLPIGRRRAHDGRRRRVERYLLASEG
jgi:hypothetical protein